MKFKENTFYRNYMGQIDLLLELRDERATYPFKCLTNGLSRVEYLTHGDIVVHGTTINMVYSPSTEQVSVSAMHKTWVRTYDFEEKNIKRLILRIINSFQEKEQAISLGQSIQPQLVILEDVDVVLDIKQSDPLKAKFMAIISATSDISEQINKNSSLESTQVIKAAFVEARDSIAAKQSVKPGKLMGMVKKSKWASNIVSKVSSAKMDNDSIHDNINAIFGPVHEKHASLIKTGEALQKNKGELKAQIDGLLAIEMESEEVLRSYASQEDIPMSVIDLHTRISTERREAEGLLMTTTAAVIAVQGTITSLGRDLPAFRAKLSKNSAIGSLVGDVTDLQDMIEDISILVQDVTEAASKETYGAIEAVFTKQIENTRAIDSLIKSAKQDAAFAEMLDAKTDLLVAKVHKDAKQLKEIVTFNPILSAATSMKRLQ